MKKTMIILWIVMLFITIASALALTQELYYPLTQNFSDMSGSGFDGTNNGVAFGSTLNVSYNISGNGGYYGTWSSGDDIATGWGIGEFSLRDPGSWCWWMKGSDGDADFLRNPGGVVGSIGFVGNNLKIYFESGTVLDMTYNAVPILLTNTWQYVCVKKTQGSLCNNFNLEINGTNTSLTCITNNNPADVAVGNDYKLGNFDGGWGPFEGDLDEVRFFDNYLPQENSSNLFNYGTLAGVPPPSPTPDTINLSTLVYPSNNSQFNISTINLNSTGNLSNSTNCTLYINSTLNQSVTVGPGTDVPINYSVSFPEGSFEFYFSCNDGTTLENTTTNLFYIDTIAPFIATNFTNGTLIYNNNLTIYTNFTDESNLYSYNISLSGVQLDYKNNLNVTFYALNFSQSLDTYDIGRYDGIISIWDGHTKEEIEEFDKVTNGLFNDKLEFTDNNEEVKIYAKDGSIFDSWKYKKELSKYTFSYEPSKIRDSYTLIVEADNKISILNDENTLWQNWIIAGDKWIDFYIEGENNNVEIRRINDYKVEITISNIQNKEILRFSSIGELNGDQVDFTIFKINTSNIYSDTAIEGSPTNIQLNVSYTSESISSLSAKLIYNGTNYTSTKVDYTNSSVFTAIAIPPDILTEANVSFYWEITADSKLFLTEIANQSVINLGLEPCKAGSDILLNFTQKDETTQLDINLTDLQIELIITESQSGAKYNYSNFTNTSSIQVCLEAGTLDAMAAATYPFTIDIVSGFVATDYVQEFWYLDNGTISNTGYFNQYTSINISLYDLATIDSTTFLFIFNDEFGLPIEDGIIHTYRKYIGDGDFKEVERSKQDNNGETHVHLIEEDVIYYFVVTQYGNVIYTSDNYNAKCLSTPCQIELNANDEFQEFDSDYSNIDGTTYYLSANKTSRIVVLSYISDASDEINLTLYQYNNNIASIINTTTVTGFSGSMEVTVPLVYGNTTFFTSIHKNDEFVESKWIDFSLSGKDYFGKAGAFYAALMIMALGLMAISEGVILVIIVCIAVVLVGLLLVVDLGWISIISIICAGGIIAWKIMKKNG